jgi:hypothetical protein
MRLISALILWSTIGFPPVGMSNQPTPANQCGAAVLTPEIVLAAPLELVPGQPASGDIGSSADLGAAQADDDDDGTDGDAAELAPFPRWADPSLADAAIHFPPSCIGYGSLERSLPIRC